MRSLYLTTAAAAAAAFLLCTTPAAAAPSETSYTPRLIAAQEATRDVALLRRALPTQ